MSSARLNVFHYSNGPLGEIWPKKAPGNKLLSARKILASRRPRLIHNLSLPLWTKVRIVDVWFLTNVAHLSTTGTRHHVAAFRLEKTFLTLPARADHCLCDLVLYKRSHVRLSYQSTKFKLED